MRHDVGRFHLGRFHLGRSAVARFVACLALTLCAGGLVASTPSSARAQEEAAKDKAQDRPPATREVDPKTRQRDVEQIREAGARLRFSAIRC